LILQQLTLFLHITFINCAKKALRLITGHLSLRV